MILFFDRCLGKRLPKALQLLKPPVEILGYYDQYPHSKPWSDTVPDDEYLSHAGKNEWLVVTQDDKWHKEAIHAAAMRQHNVGGIVLSGGQDTTWVTAKLLITRFEAIVQECATLERPFLFLIDKTGHFRKRDIGAPSSDEAKAVG